MEFDYCLSVLKYVLDVKKLAMWPKSHIFQKSMQYHKKSLSNLHEKVEFWQPKSDNSCKYWRVPFNIHHEKVDICDHTYLISSQWKNQTKIPKNGQIMAVLKYLVKVSCNLTHTENLLIFPSSRKEIHTELNNYSKCLVYSSYEALWTGLNY